jgi:hypothetical protein
VLAGIGPLLEEMINAGVFVAGEGLRPSSTGVRLRFTNGSRTITPGPFQPSNELISGFCIVSVASIEDAIEWASRYAAKARDVEIDIRPVTEEWDFGAPRPEGLTTTRFMLTHKSDAAAEAGARLPLDPWIADMKKAGVFVAAEALQPSSKSVRLRFAGGKRTVIDGPFTESKELVGGYSIVDVSSRDEAIAWSSRFAQLFGELEIDIRPLYE